MGWKSSIIVINAEGQVDDETLLKTLGFASNEKIESQSLDAVMNPEDNLVFIGNYNGNTIICTQDIPLEFLDPNVSVWESKLCHLYPNTEIASLILHSVVNLWGYSITKEGTKIRVRAGSAESDFTLDEGKVFEEEKELFALSHQDDNGNLYFVFPNMPNEKFDINQVGENFVFDVSKRYFGESLDSSDTLLFETKFRGYKKIENYSESTNQKPYSENNILASKAVIEGNQINFVHKEKGVWILLSNSEFEKDLKFDEDNLFLVDEEYLFSRIPKLRGQLNQQDSTTINIDYSTGEININPQHFHFGIPTHGAKSTRQVNAGFSLIHYLNITKSRYIKPLLIMIGFLLAGIFIGWFFYIPLAIYVAFKILEVSKTRDMYYSGDLNPAIVIDAKTCKIASLTNLSMGVGTYPIIRIRKYPIPKKYKVNGAKIPVAGAYQNTGKYSHWNYYEPNPLPSGIKDDSIIKEKIESIPTMEWINLKNQIKKFDGIPKEGYYPINIETSSWKEEDLEKIEWMQFGEEK